MRPAEVHLLWARLADLGGDETYRLAREQIARAAALEPHGAEVAYAEGCLAIARRQYDDASQAFRGAVELSPDEPRYLFGLAVALRAQSSPADGKAEELRRTMVALESTATSPEQEALVAGTLFETNRVDDEALRRAERAVRGNGRCAPCAETLAAILAAHGDLTGAVRVIDRALSAEPESQEDRGLLEARAKYGRASGTAVGNDDRAK